MNRDMSEISDDEKAAMFVAAMVARRMKQLGGTPEACALAYIASRDIELITAQWADSGEHGFQAIEDFFTAEEVLDA